MNYKRIGLDFHKVITADPMFFQQFCQIARKRFIDIYIISGGPLEYIKQYLEQQQIPYKRVWCIYDYYKDKTKIIHHTDGSFTMNDDLWNRAKAEYCRQHQITIHVDDSLIYGKYFTTPYCLYNPIAKNGIIGQNIISFNGNVDTVIDKLLALAEN